MKKPSRRRRNAGFALLIVMACLAIVTVLVAGWARMAMVENRQQRSAEDRQQARWLAEAALQRAAAHLLLDREYQGETWQVTAADVDRVGKTVPQPDPSAAADTATKAPGVGLVVITTAPVPDRAGARKVEVKVEFPLSAAGSVGSGVATNRISRQIMLDLPAPTASTPPENADGAAGTETKP